MIDAATARLSRPIGWSLRDRGVSPAPLKPSRSRAQTQKLDHVQVARRAIRVCTPIVSSLYRWLIAPSNGAAPRVVPVVDGLPEEAAGAFREAGELTLVPGSGDQGTAFVGMVRLTQWLNREGVTKTAGAAAERFSVRLSVIAVLGTCAAVLVQPSVPTGTRASVPVEILRTKPAPIILHEQPAERPTN
jgi:hypothetical protein